MTSIENKLPPGTYYFESHTFECHDVDSVRKQFESLGFTVERLEQIGPKLYKIYCAMPWNQRKALLRKIQEHNQACDIER